MTSNKTSDKKEKRTLCGICPAGCWVIVPYDKEGKLEKVITLRQKVD